MKTNLLKAIAFAIVMSSLFNCSIEPVDSTVLTEINSESLVQVMVEPPCSGADPISRITNNSDNVVNFEIHDANGILVSSAFGLNPGDVSPWLSFPIGLTTFTVSNVESSKPVQIDMGLCMVYDVTINVDNQLDTDVPIQL
jgi:hypothetical protein